MKSLSQVTGEGDTIRIIENAKIEYGKGVCGKTWEIISPDLTTNQAPYWQSAVQKSQ